MITRRGLFAMIGAALVAPKVMARIGINWIPIRTPMGAPTLYGDGVHDDTDALQAWFDGKAVVWPDGSPVGHAITHERFYLPGHKLIVAPNGWSGVFSYNQLCSRPHGWSRR